MSTLLKNVHVLPMQREIVLKERDVLIESGRIMRIGQNLDIPGATPFDGSGKYLLPGFFDMHAHIISTDMFPLFLVNGVTSVRNLWGFPRILEWAQEVERGERVGPSIYSTSALVDGVETWVGAEIVKTPEEAEAAVRRALAQGYRQIKTYPDIPREAYFRIMALARQYGLQVVGHANRNVRIDELIASGYHTIEHASVLPANDDEVIKLALAGVWHVPTTVIVRALREYGRDGKPLSDCPYYAYVNANERKDWQGIIDTMKAIPRFKDFDDEAAVRRSRLFAETSECVLVGTDQANPGVVAGFSYLDELVLMVRDLGLTPYQVLQKATVRAAEYLEIADRVGSVEEGKQSDLLLVDANPLEDIANGRKLSAVIKAGVMYERSRLDAMLEEVRSMQVADIEFVGENTINPVEKR